MKNSIIFHLSRNKDLAEKIANIAGIPLGKCEIDRFADGEILVRNLSDIKGKTVYVVQSTGQNSSDSLMELLIAIDAFKNSACKEVVAVIPYYGFSRQDRVARKGEPITAKLVAHSLQAAGADRVICIDLHTQQIQGFFSCPVANLETYDLFGEYFIKRFKELGIKENEIVVVSPDHGSDVRVRDLSSLFSHADIAVISKRRPAPNQSEVVGVVGDIKDKTCLIIDDIIDTGGTINNAVDAMFKKGAKDVFVCATHAVFSKGNVIDKRVKEIVVTDTLQTKLEGVKVITVANLLANYIMTE